MARRSLWLGWLSVGHKPEAQARGFLSLALRACVHLGLAAGLCPLASGVAEAQGTPPPRSALVWRCGLFRHRSSAHEAAAAQVPLQELPAEVREQVQRVVEKPTLFTQGPTESFTCCPGMYQWLLEHPDQAVKIWRRLGAACMDVQNRGEGVFGWTDGQGSDIRWWTVHRGPSLRIWYAEGKARAAGLVPLVPVRAVVVMHHDESRSPEGLTLVQHQVDMFMYTDSRTAALITRLLGPTAPRLAEQCAGQMEMFFSALAWYLDQHPLRAEKVLAGILPPEAPQWPELRQRARTPRPQGSVPPVTMTRYGG